MKWQEVCEHPALQDLPFKIELNERGQLVMSPTKVKHSAFQGKIAAMLQHLKPQGYVLTECAIHTRKGTKVADVAWVSPERFEQIRDELECSVAPEICVEIMSSSNTEEEMAEKRELYFEMGAIEVWLCSEDGDIRFYDATARLKQSKMIPTFPQKIIL
ncbi:MAG: Uma2 family endonuclease [Calditrichaeota bacterium]|nr:MAG: Uma2 family endonuclease [Calditrichota bacterium]